MNSSPINWFLLSLLLFSISSVSGFLVKPITTVVIHNDIGAGSYLTFHCKSKNDDLGVHVLTYGYTYTIKFRPLFMTGTLYFCGFEWDGTVHRFDIYDEDRDDPICTHCEWKIKPTGPCMQNPRNSKFDICYGWKP
ncbi:hypothetical protein F3Y22_tig00117056pilonHSYRG00892 [Hibiscus syriacus]|uniref:S-protein homolog n=1 Tax=Hibiscus syriacus TaxID=106335 RepID=A0A6A2XBQ4_HIBSY|nr:hypothetical protein F3Y22_tig00117056pilonHSYRG00892 [Hibiscus syriacus]